MTDTPRGKYLRTFLAPTCNPVTSQPLNCVLTTIARPAILANSCQKNLPYRARSIFMFAVFVISRGDYGIAYNSLFAAYVGPIPDQRQGATERAVRKISLNRFSTTFTSRRNPVCTIPTAQKNAAAPLFSELPHS